MAYDSPLFFLDDLVSRERLDAGHSQPARLAVIGQPVAHSLSPRMHQAALDEAGIAARYIKVEVEPGQVAEAFARMRALGFTGCNVTVPHKLEALAACDGVDPAAAEMGAVNTVRFEPAGLRGFNTDGYGFERAVLEDLGLPLAGAAVLIAGAGGGAGGAIAVHCARQGVARLTLVNRSRDKLEELAKRLSRSHPALPLEICDAADPELAARARQADLLVNASSPGLKEDDASPLPPDSFRVLQAAFDTVYRPRTAFQLAAIDAGALIATGKGMLLHQGAAAFRLWFPDHGDPVAAMRRGLADV